VGTMDKALIQVSPSQLEEFLDCPFRYFLKRVLKIRQVKEPEQVVTVTGMDRGGLIHRLMQKVYTRAKQKGLLPLNQNRLGQVKQILRQVAGTEFASAQNQGVVGHPLIWEVEKVQIIREIEDFLEREASEGGPWLPEMFESFFAGGYADRGGAGISFRGRIDRLDRGNEGAVRVIDYKTGTKALTKDTLKEISRGKGLQLAVYLLAAAECYGADLTGSRAEFVYLSRGGERRCLEGQDWEKASKILSRAAEIFKQGCCQGMFFPNYSADGCRSCDYSLACGYSVFAQRLYQAKQGNKFILDFFSFKEGE